MMRRFHERLRGADRLASAVVFLAVAGCMDKGCREGDPWPSEHYEASISFCENDLPEDNEQGREYCLCMTRGLRRNLTWSEYQSTQGMRPQPSSEVTAAIKKVSDDCTVR